MGLSRKLKLNIISIFIGNYDAVNRTSKNLEIYKEYKKKVNCKILMKEGVFSPFFYLELVQNVDTSFIGEDNHKVSIHSLSTCSLSSASLKYLIRFNYRSLR